MLTWTKERVPLLSFLLLYILTGLLGSILILSGSDEFWAWLSYFSGITLPDIYYNDLPTIIALLIVPPITMWTGYEIGVRLTKRTKKFMPPDKFIVSTGSVEKWALGLFLVSFSISMSSLLRAGAFTQVTAWLDYNQFIQMRYKLFNTLHFFEFVNIYTIMPTFGALTILNSNKKAKAALGVLSLIIITNVFIFQKKPLITAFIIISISLIIYYFMGKKPRLVLSRRMIISVLGAGIAMYSVYLILILVPILSEQSQVYTPSEETTKTFAQQEEVVQTPIDDASNNNEKTTDKTLLDNESSTREGTDKPVKEQEEIAPELEHSTDKGNVFRSFAEIEPSSSSRFTNIALYALMAPINRTSATNIVYPLIFPAEREYYGLDLGQDIIGFGNMPNDNVVVWDTLYPDQPGGSAAAPFHIVLYSQGGLIVSIIGAFILGIVLALGWQWSTNFATPEPVLSVLGSLVVLFGVYISMDAFRNSVTVSYGLLWPVGCLVFLMVISSLRTLRKGDF